MRLHWAEEEKQRLNALSPYQDTGWDEHSAQASADVPLSTHMPRVQTSILQGAYFNCTPGSFAVTSTAGFKVGDTVEINMDGIARTVTSVDSSGVSFTPPLPGMIFVDRIMLDDWGPSPASLQRDASLPAGSPGLTLSSSGGPVGTPVSLPSFQAGEMGHGVRVLPALTADVQAIIPNPITSWSVYLY